jgi:hypothetical protein
MDLEHENIHKTVLLALNANKKCNNLLDVIGCWYNSFLNSKEVQMILHVPNFSEESLPVIYEYLRSYYIVYELLSRPEVTDFTGTCLFSIIDYSPNRNPFSGIPLTLDYKETKGDMLFWGKDTQVPKIGFLPVFMKTQVVANENEIYNSFKLFKAIQLTGLLEHPILIDLDKGRCLSVSAGKNIGPARQIWMWPPVFNNDMSRDELIQFDNELPGRNIKCTIALKYPRNTNINKILLEQNQCEHRFQLHLSSRFYFKELKSEEIALLPSEIKNDLNVSLKLKERYVIINTNHNKELYDLLKAIKVNWKEYDFNKFTTPFPKNWLMMLNKGLPLVEWKLMFKKAYSIIEGKEIMGTIERIIELVYELDWPRMLAKQLKGNILIRPTIQGPTKNSLDKVRSTFLNYLQFVEQDIEIIDDDKTSSKKKIVFTIDGSNINHLVNVMYENSSLRIIIPDFIGFNIVQWSRYHLYDVQYKALLSPLRKKLDSDIGNKEPLFKGLRLDTVQLINREWTEYKNTYAEKPVDEVPEELLVTNEEVVYTSEEQNSIASGRKTDIELFDLKVEIEGERVLKLKSKQFVLIQRNELVKCYAEELATGDCFITIEELETTTKKDRLIDKLNEIPDEVKDFQTQLGKIKDPFKRLSQNGYNVSKKYFEDNYLVDINDSEVLEFTMPKKKNNWRLICELLHIERDKEIQTWIAYYSKKNLREVKELYIEILSCCISKNKFGDFDDPKFIEEIASLIGLKGKLFRDEEEADLLGIASNILQSIENKIEFHKIIRITNL